MASLNSQQAGRDAESYDDDRKDGRYAAGGDRAHWLLPAEPRSTTPSVDHLDPMARASLDKAMAQIERAFSRPNGIEPMFPKAVKLGRAA